MSFLVLNGVSKRYFQGNSFWSRKTDVVQALNNVSFSLKEGESLGLVGESGCGKSTLARLILGLEKPDQGQIYFANQDISLASKGWQNNFRKEVQLIFQDCYASFNPRMRVKEIMAEPMENFYPRDRRKYLQRSLELLELVGLHSESLSNFPHELSGGQRQRLAIARALVSTPKLLVCDEAIANLDVSLQGQILHLLQRLREQLGLSYIFISHHLPAVQYLADKIVVMYGGRIMEVLDRKELIKEARHPYTLSLLDALPIRHPRERKRKRYCLKGEASCSPTGCPFHLRCPKGIDICSNIKPDLLERKGHWIACHLV